MLLRRRTTRIASSLTIAASLSCAGRTLTPHAPALEPNRQAASHTDAQWGANDSSPGHAVPDSTRRASPLPPTLDPDTLLVEVRLEGIAHRLVKALMVGGELYLPTQAVFDLLGAGASGDSVESLITVRRLRDVLGTAVAFDGGDLVVTIHPTPEMPAARRRLRDREHAVLRSALPTATSPTSVAPERGDGVLAIDYDVFGAAGAATEPQYAVRAGLGILGGELSTAFGSAAASPGGDVAWTLIRPGARFVSRLTLGASTAGPLHSRSIQGISFGNAPMFRPAIIEQMLFTGTLPAGWTVDAYRAGRLFAFDSVEADGLYSLIAPVVYGENVVDLIAYGPRGQRMALQEFLRYSPAQLAQGQSEYSVSFGRCRRENCRVAGNVETRVGLLPGVTLESGVFHERTLSGSDRITPYGSLVALLPHGTGVEVEGFDKSITRLSARFEPSRLAGIEALWLNAPPQELSTGSSPASRSVRISTWASLSARPGATAIHAQLRHTPDPVSPGTEVTLGTSHTFGGTQWRPYTTARLARGTTESGVAGVELLVLPSPRHPAWLSGTWLRSLVEVDHTSGAVHRIESTLSRQVTRDLRFETEAQWSKRSNDLALALRVVTHTSGFRGTARARRSSTAPYRSTWDFGAGGSVIADPYARRLVMSSEPSVNRAGLSVLAFLDLNDDGVRQKDEPPVGGAGVIAGNRVLTTDAEGRAYFWGAPAFEPILLTVDSLTVPPHWHVPAPMTAVLRGTRTGHIVLPLVPGSTLEGKVLGVDFVDLGAVSLWLEEEGSSRRQPVEVFRDGTFYMMSVRPGNYALSAVLNRDSATLVGPRVSLVVPAMSVADAQQSPARLAQVTIDLGAPAQGRAIPPCVPGVNCRK